MKRARRAIDYRELALLGAILLLALIVRAWGLNFNLPYLTHPDEPNKIAMAQEMFKTGDLNPHYFWKPTLFIYLNALLYVPYYFVGRAAGVFAEPEDIASPLMITLGNGWTAMPTTVLMARSLTVVAALLCIVLVYLIARHAFGRKSVGYLAALMLAVSPTHVNSSRLITVNVYLAFAILCVTWFSLLVYRRGRTRDYLLAGLSAGMAVSFKYPGAVVASILLAAQWLRAGWPGFKDWRLYAALLCIPAGFLIGTPFALLDYRKFIEDVLYEFTHYSSGHAGMEGDALQWYLRYAWRTEGIVVILAIAGMARGLIRRDKVSILLSVFPVIYFVFIASFTVRNDRTFLPLAPFVALFAASFLVYVYDSIQQVDGRMARFAALLALLAVVLVAIGPPAYRSFAHAIELTKPDGRDAAQVWIEENLPAGSRITLEGYTPYVSPGAYVVNGVTMMIEHPLEWYIDQEAEYLVFGQEMFGRYYKDPERYGEEIARYERLFDETRLVAKFTDGGYEVQIREVPASVRSSGE